MTRGPDPALVRKGEPQSELREEVSYQQPILGIYYSKRKNQTQGTSKGTVSKQKSYQNKTLTQTQLTLNLLTDFLKTFLLALREELEAHLVQTQETQAADPLMQL